MPSANGKSRLFLHVSLNITFVMEAAPEFWQDPEILQEIYVSTTTGPVSGTEASRPAIGTLLSKSSPQKAMTAANMTALIARDPACNATNNALTTIGHRTVWTGAGVSTVNETMVPLSAFSHFSTGHRPLVVNHQDRFIAATISFNLAPGVSLSEATEAI